MARIPPSMLNRMYEQDSLRNTQTGFELAVKNRLAPTTMTGIGPLIVDGVAFKEAVLTVSLERPSVKPGRRPSAIQRSGADVTDEKTLFFDLNAVARLSVAGEPLPPGNHELVLSLTTREVGDITVKAVDQVAGP